MTNLSDLNWLEVDGGARRVLLVPLGSLEQHGPHLPLDTDTRIALAVARGAARGRYGVAVAPPVAFGSSGEHAAFAGTLSIGTRVLCEVLVELGRDASRDWNALLFVNGHGGNVDAVRAAVARLRAEGCRCEEFSVSPAVGDAVSPAMGDAHAGMTETSLMLHLDPGAVRLDLAEPGERRPIAELIDRLRADGVRSVSPNGVLGDPRGATAADGRRLYDELIARCGAAIDGLLVAAEPARA